VLVHLSSPPATLGGKTPVEKAVRAALPQKAFADVLAAFSAT
jgi:hypothetical protein